MPLYRRTAYALLASQDIGFVDIRLLLHGTVEPATLPQPVGLSALTGSGEQLSRAELDTLLQIPSREWSEAPPGQDERCAELARKGLLVSDADDAELRELRRRDETLTAGQWHVFAALYHFLTRWQGQDVWEELPESALAAAEAEIVQRWGKPPPPFHSRDGATVSLPSPIRDGPLYDLLGRRRTTRAFDQAQSMSLEDLSALLYHTFGCRGYARLEADLVVLRKSSPSGGALHPTEAYPLVRDVEGVDPGVYHYNAGRHLLERVASLSAEEVREVAVRLAAGQPYAGEAQVLIVLATRFSRNFWKYRKHDRAYAVLLMDAAHLSQTFYLVCAELGLGAFVTAAVNSVDAEEQLGLDGFSEGVIALCGCGKPGAQSRFDAEFLPYMPGETSL